MVEIDALCPAALKTARKRANGNRGFTQEQLAKRIGCTKDSVCRWDRGEACRWDRGEVCRVRAHLRKPLCEALGVEWDAPTTPPSQEATPRPFGITRMQRWVSRHVPPALLLVAERYGTQPKDVLDIAPLLFHIVAERSLLEGRRRLDEFYAMQDEADRRLGEKSAHLGGIITARSTSADEILEQEEMSLRARDLFGSLMKYEFRDDDDEGPFVHFVRSLAEGLPQDAATSIESWGGDTFDNYRIADDTLRKLTGITEDEKGSEILYHIWCGGIDLGECLGTRRKRDEASYRQWLQDALAEAEEASKREVLEMFGESVFHDVSDTVAAASQERNTR